MQSYLFCKLKPKYNELEKTSKFKISYKTLYPYSTITDRQHRVILTFLTFHLSVVLALLAFVSQYMSLWQQSVAHSGYL